MTVSVFIPNHMGMRRLDEKHEVSYLEQQVTTSRNIANPALLDFYYGGLNSQIEHHLFPRVAHNRYRDMRPIVRKFCDERGIAYHEDTLYRALASVGNHLGDMTAAYLKGGAGRCSSARSSGSEMTATPMAASESP
jgi:fatty acid desaturase